jgi:cell division septum initiation protein DivIVA
MTEMATKNFDDIAGAQREMDDAQSQWTLEEGRLRSQYDTDMADLEADKQRQISSAAATLQMFKPFLGG